MLGQGGQADPVVAVEEQLAGRAGRGVVVDAGAFGAGAVALGGGVVQGQRPARPGVEGAAAVAEQQAGAGGALGAAEGAQRGVGTAELGGDAGGAEPGGGGAAAAGQEFPEEQWLDRFGVTLIEETGQPAEEVLDGVRCLSEDHEWLSRLG